MSAPSTFIIRQTTLGAYYVTVIRRDGLRPYEVCLRNCINDTTPVVATFSTEATAVYLAQQLEHAIQDGASFGPTDDFSDLV